MAADNSPDANINFRFVPDELATKCRQLIERYHAVHGYSCLSDILWQSDARAFIHVGKPFGRIFNKACKLRNPKRANELLVSIAVIILALEVLVRDFSGWGNQFPDAKQRAKLMLAAHIPRPRLWLMDTYVYQRFGVSRDSVRILAPDRQL